MTFRSRPLLDLARGRPCMVGVPNVCNMDSETTVTAHNPFGDRGIGSKCSDADTCWACSSCHDYLDGRTGKADQYWRTFYFERAKTRTQDFMWHHGLIQVAGKPAREKSYKPPSKVLPRNWPPRAA